MHERIRARHREERVVAPQRAVRLGDLVEHVELAVREVPFGRDQVLARLQFPRVDPPEIAEEEVERHVRRPLPARLAPGEVATAVAWE